MAGLNWVYQDHASIPEYRAEYRGLIIKAIHDQHPSNPFTEYDGHWPMMVYSDRSTTDYDGEAGGAIVKPMNRFTPEHLIHDQIAIAKVLNFTVPDIMEAYGTAEPVKYCNDAEELRTCFEQALDDLGDGRAKLTACAELFTLLGIPNTFETTTGHCQGDWAEVLVVGTPEKQAEFGNTSPPEEKELSRQVDLYGDWAWGNTYGYVVCSVDPDDADELIEHDSCWGYYGDHEDSGLEEAAIEAADGMIGYAQSKRNAKLKELIRNRVPVALRGALLAEAGRLAA